MNSITKLLICLIFLAFVNLAAGQTIVINEILSSNVNGATDEDGSHEDWVEIYNTGASAVSLNGFGLSDEAANLLKWKFPNVTLNSHAYLRIWCSDKNRTVAGQPLHTNWKISSSGEAIYVSNASGVALDNSPAVSLNPDISYGRLPNGTGGFVFFAATTPGAANGAVGYSEVLDEPTFSQISGFYTAGFNLTLSTSTPGATIIYTLDGSEPNESNLGGTTYNYKNKYPKTPGQAFGTMLFKTFTSLQYSAPIAIADRTPQANKISTISSTYDFTPPYIPSANVFKGTVVKAKVVKAGALASKTVTRTYFITPLGSNRFTLPVISLSIDENKLFDYEDGIYVAGKTFDQFRTDFPTEPADYPIGNYTWKGEDYERMANLSYFVGGQEKLNQNIGIRIQGNYSRLYPSKSMNFYSKSDYGTDGMHYKFFSDETYDNFARVVVKNSGSDFYNSFFKDALCSELAKPLHTQIEANQPAVTFINGEYWGLLTIREKYDSKFFERVYGIPEDQIDLVENEGSVDNVEEGDNVDYQNMYSYIQNNSLVGDANFNYIKTRMDTESFTDYFISNIFFANEDWPGNNIIYWRKKTAYDANAPYGTDGRWRWAIHDMSSSWYDYDLNVLALATAANGPDFPNPPWSTLILRKLLENPTFKNDFINRFADILNTSFLPSRVTAQIAVMKAQIQPEMPEQITRWKAPLDMDEWNYFTGELNTFANQRPAIQRNHIRSKFSIANNINATLNVSAAAQGYIKINTIDIIDGTPGISGNPYPWTGIYFSNIPVKLKAIANPGYAFSHWTGASTSTNAEITITSAANFSITAVFVPSSFSTETSQPIYFWYMDGAIPNNQPLTSLNSTYELGADGTIQYSSCLAGYPFNSGSPLWRHASMERRNSPTPINYRPEANGNAAYVAANMKALQVTQPFQSAGLENTMVFNFSTVNYKNIKFSFAAMDEGAATGIAVDYSANSGAPVWITTGLTATSFVLTTGTFQLYESDFTSIAAATNNPNFKIRLRFTGPNMTADAGNRVTFNNIALDGVRMPLTYPTPNIFPVGTAITPLNPTVTASVTSYSVSPSLPAGLTLNTTTGAISGTPTVVTASAPYTVTATNPGGSATFDVVIAITQVPPSALSYTSPNVYTVGASISSLNPTVTGTVASYSASPALPLGLSLNTATGVILGTPTTVSPTATYTVTASNSGGNTSFGISITVNAAAPISLSYNSPNVYTAGSVISSLNPSVTGAVTGYSVSPALPLGLSLNTATGVISGTPTTITATATYTVTAGNSGGNTSFGISITVNAAAPISLSYNSPNIYTIGSAISSLNPSVTGIVASYSVSPALPLGLSLNTATGVISGTPTTITATATYTVTAGNSGGNTSFGISITVNAAAPISLSYNSPNIYTIGSAISSLNPSVTGIVASYSVSPALPLGLSLNTATGVISGTPTIVTPTATYTVTANNSGGNTSFGVVITVNAIAPNGLSYNSPNVYTVGSVISSLNPTVTGTVTGYSVSPSLPLGLSLNTSTGVISGTPTIVTATATYTVTAGNSGGNTSFGISITVNAAAPSSLSYNSPNVYTVGSVISSLNPSVTGTVISYSVSPALPLGLSLNTSTGVISGTPTIVTATATYTVTATNSGGNTSFGVSITVNAAAPSSLSYNSPNVYTVGSVISSLNPSVTGTVTGYSVSPALPAGLVLNTSTGVISGTPTTVSPTATYTVMASNSGGNTSFGISITVNAIAPTGLSYNSPNVYTIGSAISSLNPSITGAVISYSVSPALPAGLVLNTSTGVISGTPTTVSPTATYTVTASNSGGNTSFGISITVNAAAPISLSYNSPNVYTAGSVISSLNPSVTGTVISYSVSPALPLGLSLNTSTGVISGTPTIVTATATYTVTATNSGGNTSFGISITVNAAAPSSLSYNSPNVYTVGSVISSLNPTVTGTVTGYSVSPALTLGLSLNTATGVISGTPTTVSPTATYTVTATNSGGNTSFGISITVNAAAPISLSYNSPNIYTIGSAISSLNPTVTGTVTGYSVSPALPLGLSLNTATGVILGTPITVSPTATYTITATNSGGNTSFGISITVNAIAPTGLSYNSPNVYTIGSAISSLNPTVTGTVTGYSVSPALPLGLSLNTSTGVISGTPTTISPAATYTVTASNSGGNSTFGIQITVNDVAPNSLSYNSPNIFTLGETIMPLQPTISEIVEGYSVSPALPDGLSLDTITGIISGTPTVVSPTAVYTITATNSGGDTSFDVSITVNDLAPDALSYNSPNVYTVGSAISSLNPTVTGNVIGYSVAPSLPDGLSLDAATGIISGTPTVVSPTAVYTITATNSGGDTSFDVSITVNDLAPDALSYNSPNVFTVGSAISSLNPTVTGNVIGYSVAPSLPDGLSLDAATGIISGTPTVVSPTAVYTITATNSGGDTSFDVSITVNDLAPTSLSYNSPNVFTVGSAISSLNPTVTGNVIGYSVAPALPDGLSLDTITGIISGTPTIVTATATYTVTASNSGGNTSFGISITVNAIAPTSLSYDSPNVYTVGSAISSLNPTVTGNVIGYSVAPALPDGLSLDTITGIISGTPTVVSPTAVYTITATNSGGDTSFDVSITVNDLAPTSLSYNSPNVFTVGSVISSLSPTVTGNVIGYSVAPALPGGLSLDAATGIISGTPEVYTTTTTYAVTATNSGGSVSFDIMIAVNDAAPTGLSYNSPNIFTVGTVIGSLNPVITGNDITYSIVPDLPPGLAFDPGSGVISGTPGTVSPTTVYTVTATNSGGSISFDFSIVVNDIAPDALSYNSPNVFTVGSAISSLSPTVTGNVIGYSVAPSLPDGLSLDAATGIISGTPTMVSPTAVYTVTATNSGGDTSFDVSITVNDAAPFALSYTTPNVYTVGLSIVNLTPAVSGNVTIYTVSPDLPPGLSIDPTTGIISGIPLLPTATETYTVTATNSGGSVSFDVVITIELPLGVGGHHDLNFSIYPNPFVDVVNITGIESAASYKLYSVEGKLIETGKVMSSRITFRDLPNGMYLIELTSDGKSVIKKLIRKD